MKKILFAALTAVVAIGIAVPVALGATKPVPVAPTFVGSALTCFDGPSEATIYGGSCTVSKYGVATLNNSHGDKDGEYSGVYVKNSNLVGKAIGTIGQLGFSYTGTRNGGIAPNQSRNRHRRRRKLERVRLHLRSLLQ